MKKLLMLISLLGLSSCLPFPTSQVEDSFEVKPKSGGTIVTGLCYNDQYAPAEENIIRELDILIVPDTSGSIVEERGDIADGFDFFLRNLPEEIDYRVGVVLAHAKTKWAGSLYKKGTEPLVLDSQEYGSTGKEQLIADLKEKLRKPSEELYSDGGEMGLYSLRKALTENLDQIKDQGFLRDTAALAVIFVADEQDICAKYPEGVSPVIDRDGREDTAKAELCLDEGNYIITPEIVLDAIKAHQGDRPYVVGGVIYNNPETVPNNGSWAEDEVGYGYLETIELAGGITVDLASGDYGDGLTRLGKMAQVAVKPEKEFNLKTTKVHPDTIEVLLNGHPVPYNYLAETNQVQLQQDRPDFSVVNVKYCEREEKPMEAVRVIAGGMHTCAILLDGKAKCWGNNSMGQLGYGHNQIIGDNETLANIPTLNFDKRIIDMSAGSSHTCAVLEGGEVKCWGGNLRGQLGQNHKNRLGVDEDVSEIPAIKLLGSAKKIYSGTEFNCALLESGNIQCWGDNEYGQLGHGNVPYANFGGNPGDMENLPTVNLSGKEVVHMDISTISSHACAALSDGKLKCWGNNEVGQLGLGHTNNIYAPSDSVPFSNKVLQIATGFNHTCSILGGQKLSCWGDNKFGQIGLGVIDTIGDDPSDVFTHLDMSGEGDQFSMVAAGNMHTCAIGIDYNVYCWGQGSMGATGLGHSSAIGDNEAISKTNTKVKLPFQAIQVAAGVYHTCALTRTEGKVICWGSNNFGQLGLGHKLTVGINQSPTQTVQLLPEQ